MMRKLAFVAVVLALAACAVCDRTDDEAVDYMILRDKSERKCFFIMKDDDLTRDKQGGIGDNVTYVYSQSTQTLTISGTTDMDDFESFFYVYYCEFRHLIHTVVIEEGVTSIGNYAFSFLPRVTTVSIPASVTRIGENVFSDSKNLVAINVDENNNNFKSVNGILFSKDGSKLIQYPCGLKGEYTIDNDVSTIGDFAFQDCKGLTNVTIPDSVTKIGAFAFSGCSSLSSMVIPSSVTSIGSGAFSSCYNLKSIDVDGNNKAFQTLGGVLFNINGTVLMQYPGGKAGDYTVPGDVSTIIAFAFDGCHGLTSLTVPSTVTWIGRSAFSHCDSTSAVTIESNVESLGTNAFLKSKIATVVLPESITAIEDHSFYRCDNLVNVTIPPNTASIGEYAFYGCHSLTQLTIPSKISTIAQYAFQYCSKLEHVTFEDGCNGIGYSAFMNCTSLSSIVIPSSVDHIEENAFTGCTNLKSAEILANLTTIPSYMFEDCRSLQSVNIPDSVESFGYSAFKGCSSLTSIDIPSSVSIIEMNLFQGCSSLTRIDLPSGIQHINSRAFEGCTSLSIVIIPSSVSSIASWAFSGCISLTNMSISADITTIGVGAFAGCENLASIDVDSGNGNYESVEGVLFKGKSLVQYPCGKSNTYLIPSTTTAILGYAFAGCASLESVEIPTALTSIAGNAFEGCSSLTNVNLPSQLSKVDYRVFRGCSKLKQIDIPSSVTTIDMGAFESSGLESVSISSKVTQVYSTSFSRCDNLAVIDVDENNTKFKAIDNVLYSIKDNATYGLVYYPGGKNDTDFHVTGVQSIYEGAFTGCSKLQSVTIDSTVTFIGQSAFSDCINLESVTMSTSGLEIAPNVFDGCKKLRKIIVYGTSEPQCPIETFDNCGGLEFVCAPPDFGSSLFCGFDGVCRSSSCDKIEELYAKQNQCRELSCSDSEPALIDKCSANNPQKKCFELKCQDDGTCSNTSLYQRNESKCVASAECTEEGWVEIEKNCTSEVLNDPETPKSINAETASCYEFVCASGKCTYTAHEKCGKVVCDEEACKANVSGDQCAQFTGCGEELIDGVWEPKCLYDKKEGWQTIGCYEFSCDGSQVKSKCNDKSDKVQMVCMNDTCVERDSLKTEGWVVEIVFKDNDVLATRISELVAVLSKLSGVSADKMKVGTEIDDKGRAVCIVIVDDDAAATAISNAVKTCIDGTGAECTDLLKKIDSHVVTAKVTYDNEAGRARLSLTVMALLIGIVMSAMK